MFNFFFNGFRPRMRLVFCLWFALNLAACRTAPPMSRADLSAPGWKSLQGQAVWRAGHHAPEIAGELLVATHVSGRVLLQFTKSPFPLVIAQTSTNGWQLEVPAQGRFYSGRGPWPARVIWFELPPALAGRAMPNRWRWRLAENRSWRLDNPATGESLEGWLNP